MAYGDEVATFVGTDHRFSFDGTLVAEVGGLTATGTGTILTNSGICLGATNCVTLNGTTDRVTIPTTGDIDDSATTKGFFAWVKLSDAQLPFCRIMGEGNSTTSVSICCGPGNSIIWEADNGTFVAQRYSDKNLTADRAYHLLWLFDSTGLRGFLDGIEQTKGADFAQTSATIGARTPIEIGDPAGTVSLGGTAVVLVSPVEMDMNEAQYFNSKVALLSDQDIFDELFVNGAIAGVTITNQAGLDAIDTTVRGDEPLNIRVNVAGNIDLVADNVTHNALAGCHVHYNGTGVCNWINANGSNASVGSASDGTLNFLTRQTLTVTVLDIDTLAAISGARVYIVADTGGDLTEGTVIANTTTNGSGIATATHDYTSDQPIIARVRKSSSAPYYKTAPIGGPLTSTPFNATVLMVGDE